MYSYVREIYYLVCTHQHNWLDVRVGYEHTSHTISELRANKEICVTSWSPGIDESFTINIATDSTLSKDITFYLF